MISFRRIPYIGHRVRNPSVEPEQKSIHEIITGNHYVFAFRIDYLYTLRGSDHIAMSTIWSG